MDISAVKHVIGRPAKVICRREIGMGPASLDILPRGIGMGPDSVGIFSRRARFGRRAEAMFARGMPAAALQGRFRAFSCR
jgi:hypothetical protein